LAVTDGAGITFYVTKFTFSIPFVTPAQWFVPHADLMVCVCVSECVAYLFFFLFLSLAE